MTDQRATLSVPSYDTSMNVGAAWSGTSWNSAGLCVNTTARVWLESERDYDKGVKSSTLTIFANGTTAGIGQLLLQSLSSNLYLFGRQTTVVAANESLFFAGAKGVKILAGHSGPADFLFNDWETSIFSVAPDDDDPASDHAKAYLDTIDTIADYWAWGDMSVSALMVTLEGFRHIFGMRASGSTAVTAAAASGLAAAAKITSAGVDFSRVGLDEVKGLHLFSYSGVNLQTTGFATVYSGTALTMAGLNSSGTGFIDASIVGGVSASIKAGGTAALGGSSIDVAAATDLTVGALGGVFGGALILRGKDIVLGKAASAVLSQVSTATLTGGALKSVTMKAALGNVVLDAGTNVELTANEVEVSAGKEVVIQGPAYTITVGISGISIALKTGASVELSSAAATATCADMALEVKSTGIKIGGASAQLVVDAAGVWKGKAGITTLS